MLMFDLSLHMEVVTVLAVTTGEETGRRNAFVHTGFCLFCVNK